MNARVLQVTAGTGPVEVRRFVALLAESLCDRCSERGAIVREVVVHGDEEAPGSVEIHVAAAPSSIDDLAGTHALVARSEDRGRKSRKRWYAGVQLSEEVESEMGTPGRNTGRNESGSLTTGRNTGRSETANLPKLPVIHRDEVTITAMRAGGPGGQHVNKTSSAVRVVHRPSGVTVKVSDERSQRENVRVAMERLAKLLAQRDEERVRGARAGRRLMHYRVERGRPAFVYELDRNGGLLFCEETCSR